MQFHGETSYAVCSDRLRQLFDLLGMVQMKEVPLNDLCLLVGTRRC